MRLIEKTINRPGEKQKPCGPFARMAFVSVFACCGASQGGRGNGLANIARQGGLNRDDLPGLQMAEAERTGVQGLALDRVACFAVHSVADERVAKVGQVDADLVGAACRQSQFKQGRPSVGFDGSVMGNRAVAKRCYRPPVGVRFMGADRGVNRAGRRSDNALDEGDIRAFELA